MSWYTVTLFSICMKVFIDYLNISIDYKIFLNIIEEGFKTVEPRNVSITDCYIFI